MGKYGKKFRKAKIEEWEDKYFNYKKFKQKIKQLIQEKKKNNKIEHSTITKKKIKNNLLVIPSEEKFQRRKTSSFDVNNFQNIVLSEMENKKDKKTKNILKKFPYV